MNKFWSPIVQNLTPYTPGEQPKLEGLIKLNTNENPFPPSPKVLTVLREAVGEDLKLYPDPTAERLKATIGQYFNVQAKQVFVGNGSDEVLAHVFHALLKHDLPLLFPDITYSFYPVYCGLYGIDSKLIPLTNNYTICIDDYLQPNGGIIFPNPNAPTGCLLSLADIKRLLKTNVESVVVIDEAYIDFGGESAVTLVNQFPNLLVIQTISKSRSLAGLRVGFAIGNAALIEGLERIKNSFNSYPLGRLAITGAIMAFEDQEYFKNTRQTIILNRENLVRSMSALGFKILPSSANFIFARHPDWDAGELVKALRTKSIIVRHFKQPRIEQFMRITIGTELECHTLIQELRGILGQC